MLKQPQLKDIDVKLKIQFSIFLLLAMICFMLASAQAASLTAPRTTASRSGSSFAYTVASNAVIYQGAMVARDSSGVATPAADADGSIVVGCAPVTVDNRAANYHPSQSIAVRTGIFGWDHTGFTAADVGSLAYCLDDQTVTPASNVTYDIVAGVIVAVEGTTCFVDTGNIPRQGAQSVTSIAVSGNGTVGGTLAVTGNTTAGGTLGVTGALTGSSTISATGYKIGAQLGSSASITNHGVGSTNVLWISGGVITNVTFNP
jgi:hypothetical protein